MVEGRSKVDPRRLKPSLATLPGLKLTYEAFIKDAEGGQLPYYCYVGAVSMANDSGKDPGGSLRGELAGQPANESLSDWEPFQGETPEGQGSQWKRLRCVAPQEFAYTSQAGRTSLMTLPGVLEIYLREEGGYLIVIAWRMPKNIEPNVGLAKWAPLVAGCVSVKP